MSLINDALKKAQRQRADDDTAATASGGLAGRRNQPKGQSLVLIAAGALVLVAGSVAGTIFLLNRSPAPKPDSVASSTPAVAAENRPTSTPAPENAKAAAASATLAAPAAPVVSAPKSALPETKNAPAPTSTLATNRAPSTPPPASTHAPTTVAQNSSATPASSATLPANAPATPGATAVAPTAAQASAQAPSASAPPSAPAALPEAVAKLQEQIHSYLENLRIVGVRAAGEDSRVRMNDRTYRLNEIVDRTLQLRLIKVESNALTFSDASGATYVRYF